uniref:Uncharacterized protein n=1 Tax=Avena sativa TaxID=4498 RepID=A0ACD6ANQ0_AVESA
MTRDFVVFLVGAAIPTACIVLLLPSLCPSAGGGGIPAELQQLACNCNTAQLADRVGANELSMDASTLRGDDDDDLPRLLRSAAMEAGNTVVMTFLNEAWAAPGSLLDLFLESFREGIKTEPLLKHLVIVTVDQTSFRRCQEVHQLCYPLAVATNFTEEQTYMSKAYLEMMWVRNKFQTRVLELGYAFVFTDMDIVWFRNPLLRIPVGADIAISCDQFYGQDPYDVWKNANGGFLYARPSARTIAFFKGWYEARLAHPGKHDQDVFDKVKKDLSLKHDVAVHLVDTAYFGGFCQPKKDFRQLCTFHGNCLTGLRMKLDVLRDLLNHWKQFKITGPQGEKRSNTTVQN